MEVLISNSSKKPIYEQIVAQIKGQIMSGALREGDALPSIRLLAKELKVSVITTQKAYELLERDGFILTVKARGSFVAKQSPQRTRDIQLPQVEGYIQEAVAAAKQGGISMQEVQMLVQRLYEEE